MNRDNISLLTKDKIKKLEKLINIIDSEKKVFKNTPEKIQKEEKDNKSNLKEIQ